MCGDMWNITRASRSGFRSWLLTLLDCYVFIFKEKSLNMMKEYRVTMKSPYDPVMFGT